MQTTQKFTLFDYRDENGSNSFKKWTEMLQKSERAKLNAKLDMLSKMGANLFPQVLTGTDTSGILKLRIKGNVQLRPMLCKGPINNESEFTLLIGAKERDSRLIPVKVDEEASNRKKIIIKNSDRRCLHERVS